MNAWDLLFLGDDGPIYTNLLANGACETTGGFTANGVSQAADSANKYEGTNCIKITRLSYGGGSSAQNIRSLITNGKYYLYSGYVKNGNATSMKLEYWKGTGGVVQTSDYAATSYDRKGLLLAPDGTWSATTVNASAIMTAAEGQYAYFDALMLNEVSAADYAAGVAACLTKYPYKAP